jgi:hypothetical protein
MGLRPTNRHESQGGTVPDALREEIRPLRSHTRKIQPRATTSISPVGTVIFDADGEYFWPDDNVRPACVTFRNLRTSSPYSLRDRVPVRSISLSSQVESSWIFGGFAADLIAIAAAVIAAKIPWASFNLPLCRIPNRISDRDYCAGQCQPPRITKKLLHL